MRFNWMAILGGLVGGVLAGLVAVYATTQVLPGDAGELTTSLMVWSGVVAAVGGVLGVVGGWFVNARRSRGLGGIAAITTLLATLAGTYAWSRSDSVPERAWPYVVGVVLMLGAGLLLLAAVCGLTAALLRPQSLDDEMPSAPGAQL
ncbi:hypothetical protein SGUI_1363 [Serinicoccus hydrothermalis]|uniref:Uncharacterized protein n=1 Tax=Serinicoccus hydrothermalis TaxID=1758689 RepID=A0A1B1NBE6_9MICO|nr:hypothetical protein [Serinicoccus hydrothermalis]ANS78759.1 hypothetical protein SGUI_1363 [Serinicoccus hydrothermalis]